MQKGTLGEKLAELYLQKMGYLIRHRNFRCRYGEIDLVALKDGILCFVEVKLRSSLAFGYPSESVSAEKQKRLKRAAACYIQSYCVQGCAFRMDVIEILLVNDKPYIHHIPSAFC